MGEWIQGKPKKKKEKEKKKKKTHTHTTDKKYKTTSNLRLLIKS